MMCCRCMYRKCSARLWCCWLACCWRNCSMAWCVARRKGKPDAKLETFTRGIVKVNAATRCKPDRKRHAHYAKVQAVQDELGLALRKVFELQRGVRG